MANLVPSWGRTALLFLMSPPLLDSLESSVSLLSYIQRAVQLVNTLLLLERFRHPQEKPLLLVSDFIPMCLENVCGVISLLSR